MVSTAVIWRLLGFFLFLQLFLHSSYAVVAELQFTPLRIAGYWKSLGHTLSIFPTRIYFRNALILSIYYLLSIKMYFYLLIAIL